MTASLTALLAFGALGWLASRTWFYTGLGVEPSLAAPNDALALILFMLVATGHLRRPVMWLRHGVTNLKPTDSPPATPGSRSVERFARLQGNASTLTPDPTYVTLPFTPTRQPTSGETDA